MTEKKNCSWPGHDEKMIHYHNTEWGVPLHEDKKIFEFMVLDSFQAGLSWKTVLHKRDAFRIAFDDYDIKKIVVYDESKVLELMSNQGIIRNRLKIRATINNASCFQKVCDEFGTFDQYIWSFVKHKTIINHITDLSQIPARSLESDAMSKDLIRRGFKFVGSTICYAFMQAAGMVNDHQVSCYRYQEIMRIKG